MIESRYWKEELQRIAKSIRRVKHPPRWSVRRACVIERELMVGFFIVRRMIELNKISAKMINKPISVFSCPALMPVNKLNAHRRWETYDLNNEVRCSRNLVYITNQFIHSYSSGVLRDETGNWGDVYIGSDYERNKCIWRIAVVEIHTLFSAIAKDYPRVMSFNYNEKKLDYDVT